MSVATITQTDSGQNEAMTELSAFTPDFSSEAALAQHFQAVASAWAALTGSSTNQHISEAIGHAFGGIADEQQNTGRLCKAVKDHQAQNWTKAFKGYEWAITFLGFVEHKWNYAVRELAEITMPAEKKPRTPLGQRLITFILNLGRQKQNDEDCDEATVVLDEKTKRTCGDLTVQALQERARLFAWSFHLTLAQIQCYQQSLAQEERTTHS